MGFIKPYIDEGYGMLKVISTLFLVVLTSLFFFPFEFTFLPGFNTKMIMAGMGLVLFGINMASGGRGRVVFH